MITKKKIKQTTREEIKKKVRSKDASISYKLIDEEMINLKLKGKVLDVGSRHSEYAILCEEYVSFDIFPFKEIDLVADAHFLPFKKRMFDTVICLFVLHYTVDPKKVIDEIYSVLKKNGTLIMCVPFMYPYHPISNKVDDYWRYTPGALKYLLKDFKDVKIKKKGRFFTLIGIYLEFLIRKLGLNFIKPVLQLLVKIDKKTNLFKNTAVQLFVIARK